MSLLVMPVKPGQLKQDDINKLEEAGIIVIETEEPESIKLISPTLVIQGNKLLSQIFSLLQGKNDYLKADIAEIMMDMVIKETEG